MAAIPGAIAVFTVAVIGAAVISVFGFGAVKINVEGAAGTNAVEMGAGKNGYT